MDIKHQTRCESLGRWYGECTRVTKSKYCVECGGLRRAEHIPEELTPAEEFIIDGMKWRTFEELKWTNGGKQVVEEKKDRPRHRMKKMIYRRIQHRDFAKAVETIKKWNELDPFEAYNTIDRIDAKWSNKKDLLKVAKLFIQIEGKSDAEIKRMRVMEKI